MGKEFFSEATKWSLIYLSNKTGLWFTVLQLLHEYQTGHCSLTEPPQNAPLNGTSWWITARGLVNVFLFCIMAQIIEASSEVQASSGSTHCRENRVRGSLKRASMVVLWPLIRPLTAVYPRKTGHKDGFQRTTNNLRAMRAGSVYSQLHLKIQTLLDGFPQNNWRF